MHISFLLILAGLLGAGPAPASPSHLFTVHDMLAMERISEPQVSPDGAGIVFTLRTTDLKANKGVTDLWLVGLDGTGLHRLTTQPGGGHNPRFTPDGRAILFLSSSCAEMTFLKRLSTFIWLSLIFFVRSATRSSSSRLYFCSVSSESASLTLMTSKLLLN